MIRKILAGLLLFVFVVSSTVFCVVSAVFFALSNKDFYSGDKFVVYLHDALVSRVPDSFKGNLPDVFSSEDILIIVKKDISVDDLKPVIADISEQISNALNTGKYSFNIDLNVFAKKRGLIAEDLADLLSQKLNTCLDPGSYVAKNPRCVPKGVDREDFVRQFSATFDRELFNVFPNNFVFSLTVPNVKNVCLFSLALLFVVTGLLVFRPYIRVLKWMLACIFFFFVLFSSVVFLPTIWPLGNISDLFGLFFGRIFIYCFVGLLISFSLFVLAIIYDNKKIL